METWKPVDGSRSGLIEIAGTAVASGAKGVRSLANTSALRDRRAGRAYIVSPPGSS